MLLLLIHKHVSCECKMGQDRRLDMMTMEHLEKQKTINMCNDMLEYLKHEDVVYSIRETGTGTNIHIDLEHSTGEYPTFTIFKTYPTKKLVGNRYLKPPQHSEEKKQSLRRSIRNRYERITKPCSDNQNLNPVKCNSHLSKSSH